MDTGLWATWYDADQAQNETEFIDWLHAVYIPLLKQQPGIAWIAHYRNTGGGASMDRLHEVAARPDQEVPAGCQYLLLVGAPSPHTFFKPSIFNLERDAALRERLTARQRVRTEVYVEETRVDGPAAVRRFAGSTPGPAIQFGCYKMKSVEAELDLAHWYAQQRLPTMGQMPGCIRTRKMVSVAGWAKHGVLYEFESLEARLKNHEGPVESQTLDPNAWTGRIAGAAIYPPGSPFVGERIWPPVE